MSDHTPPNNLLRTTQEPDVGLCETQATSALTYRDKFLTLKQGVARLPDGRNASHKYLVHLGAAMMIPLFGDGIALMKRQFCYPVDRVMIEFSAGRLDPQGGALACGKRELREETGYAARRWDYLTCIHPAISYSTELIDICLVRDPKQEEAMLDEGEFPRTFITSADQLIDWARDGKISDVKTIVGTFWLEKTLSGTWAPGAI